MNRNWYAVYTKPQCEKKVAALLTKKKIENLCPLNRISNSSGYRKRLGYEPLFPTFVFVHITEAAFQEVRRTSDVINFVYWLGKPAVIKKAEIENIIHFTNTYQNIILEKTSVNAIGMVRITKEPSIAGSRGIVSVDSSRIRLTLPSLGFIMTVEGGKLGSETFVHGPENSKVLI